MLKSLFIFFIFYFSPCAPPGGTHAQKSFPARSILALTATDLIFFFFTSECSASLSRHAASSPSLPLPPRASLRTSARSSISRGFAHM